MSDLKSQILLLRNEGLSFRAIETKLGCNRSLISYHCSKGQKEKNKQRTVANRRARKEYFVELFGGKCIKCGYNKYVEALEFHHRNPDEKEIEPAFLLRGSIEEATKELKKCDLLCCRCHREVHAEIDRKKFHY